ncbi:Molybdopterin or thiamine biosynthesis adenylyltransferase [Thermodesulfobium acidiphilum]|uniref:Molybdopterin or thiamine biosynthesis adenylyltransferase n=1 Tax=Thermodesulfobium acidiphilum TaxID=1794699 RepID=A0A2R4W1A2_THEAF|nr:HesA/MoeB/ThiF family protein [Thermodesulfobium acidiphilum]AWB10480.1 Molybdopterin or thiamine biosynthesis adenylyltransferase [Thermodesulfobium acidiphilum]
MISKQFEKNVMTLGKENQIKLFHSTVSIVGMGGLGGFVLEHLVRLGVGHIKIVDKDIFEESNLNRQILSDNNSLGKPKVEIAKIKAKNINKKIIIDSFETEFNEDTADKILKGSNVAVDALDNNNSRSLLFRVAKSLGIPVVHAAVSMTSGEVKVFFPEDKIIDFKKNKGTEEHMGVISPTVAIAASIQAMEVVKILTNKGNVLKKGFYFDLMDNFYSVI